VKNLGLSNSRRLRHRLEFSRVYDLRERTGDRQLLVFAAKNDLGRTRFGVSVSKKHGNAVKRVRLKRLLREAFRLSQHVLPRGLDLILIPRQHSGARLHDYQRSLRNAVSKLARRLGVGDEP
jgi:ribonuclease P protein component